MKKKVIIVSGYFNPIHKGHIEYLNLSKQKGDLLIVIVNNDVQRKLKGSKEFMFEKERALIVSNIKVVDKVLGRDSDLSHPRVYQAALTKENAEQLQCVVSKKDISFGNTQQPNLWDYADGVDTVEFLRGL